MEIKKITVRDQTKACNKYTVMKARRPVGSAQN